MKKLRFHDIAFILSLFWGLVYGLIVPPFQSPDEQDHFYRILQLSNFQLFSEKKESGTGGDIPIHFIRFVNYLSINMQKTKEKYQVEKIKDSLSLNPNYDNTTFQVFSNTALYTPIPYIGGVLSILTGKILNLPVFWTYYLGRLFNIVLSSYLIYLTIKITPILKEFFMVSSLIPMFIFQRASFSTDALTFPLSFLCTAYIFKLTNTIKTNSKKNSFWLILLTVLQTLSKQVYAVLNALIILIPGKFFKKPQNMVFVFIAAIATNLFLLGIWTLQTGKSFTPYRVDITISPALQMKYILSEPLGFLKIAYTNLESSFENYLYSMVGHLGWLDLPLPDILVTFFYVVLMISLIGSINRGLITYKSGLWKHLFIFTILTVFIFSISLTLYLSYSLPGSLTIDGIQGRYYIPAIPLIGYLLHPLLNAIRLPIYNKRILIAALILLISGLNLASVYFIIERYYSF